MSLIHTDVMKTIDIAEARARLSYDPETGIFRWKSSNRGSTKAGDVAGSVGRHGYWLVKVAQVKYTAGRLAWAMFYGVQPDGEIDHINGDKLDNRITNLRKATRLENCRNRNFEGVRYEPDRNKWLARITVDRRIKNLGRFDTKEQAVAARSKAKTEYFGDFARD